MKFRYILFAVLIGLSGCGGTEPPPPRPLELPPETTEGLSTMGCLVNGEVLVARNKRWGQNLPPGYGVINGSGTIVIVCHDEVDNETFSFRFIPAPEDSITSLPHRFYVFEQPSLNLQRLELSMGNPDIFTRIVLENTESNWVEFTRYEPYSGGVMSGRFEFDMLTEEGDTIQIREGRFDVFLVGD